MLTALMPTFTTTGPLPAGNVITATELSDRLFSKPTGVLKRMQ